MTISSDRLTYTVEEAAELMGLSVRGVQDACASGTLSATKLAGKWLLPARTLHARLGVPQPSDSQQGNYLTSVQVDIDVHEAKALLLKALQLLEGK